MSAAAGALPGCGDDAPPDGGPTVEAQLGGGTVDFLPLADEDELELIAGPQGGHHFVVHGRARNIVPGDPQRPGQIGNPSTTFRAYDEAGQRLDLDFPPYRLGYIDEADGWYYLPSGRILQVQDEVVPTLYGTRVRITLRIQDARGNYGTDERWIRVIEEVPTDAGPDEGPPEDAGPGDDATGGPGP